MSAYKMRLRSRNERAAAMLETQADYRVLRRLPHPDEMWCRSMPIADRASTTTIAVIDCETTGRDAYRNRIIELAVVKLVVDDKRGDLLDISSPVSFLEDPRMPLAAEIEQLTGLTDAFLEGQKFDAHVVGDLFSEVDVITAHNASFDAAFVRERFPFLQHPWACSLNDVDWAAQGFGSKGSMEALLANVGLFNESAHRAGPDAWATAVLLALQASDGRTIAAHMLERARALTHRLFAIGAPFETKDALKAGGYRWCAGRRAWWLDADIERLGNEQAWLSTLSPRIRPRVEQRDWYTRHTT